MVVFKVTHAEFLTGRGGGLTLRMYINVGGTQKFPELLKKII
jgi:hypothetical protein